MQIGDNEWRNNMIYGVRVRRLRPVCLHFYLFFFPRYETISSCSQHCWIDWNSAVLCFKRLFHRGVWTFARFVRPLVATILGVWEIWSPHMTCTLYHIFLCWQKKPKNASPHRFWSRSMTRNWRLFLLALWKHMVGIIVP